MGSSKEESTEGRMHQGNDTCEKADGGAVVGRELVVAGSLMNLDVNSKDTFDDLAKDGGE